MRPKYFKNYSLKDLANCINSGIDFIFRVEKDGVHAYPIPSASSYLCDIGPDGMRIYPDAKISSLHLRGSKNYIIKYLKELVADIEKQKKEEEEYKKYMNKM